ncbi:MAG: hypothetical protein K2K96_06300 [Lachnospiraceae bacterium]|nr:hypothetical protein [Lachnospiraceae bacterium]
MNYRGCLSVTPVCLFIFCEDIHADRRDRNRVFLAEAEAGRMDSFHRPVVVVEVEAENRMDRMVLPVVPNGQAVCRETYYERT